MKILSAIGSSIAPNLEVTSNFRARYPSKKSEIDATKKTIRAESKSCFKKTGMNKNANNILDKVMKLGRDFSINFCVSYLRIQKWL